MQDYKNLIYLGPGMRLSLDELIMLAERVWLVDASVAVVENLKRQAGGCVNVNVIQGLVDKEQRIGTFYEYNLAWVNGPLAADEKTLRLYPGLRCLSSQQQRTIDIKQLIRECLGQDTLIDVGGEKKLLVIDLGNQAKMLLNELHASGQLAAFSAVVIVPPFRGSAEVDIPSGLHDSLIPASEIPIGLPENSQAFIRHPLVQQQQQQLQNLEVESAELKKQLKLREAELNKALQEQGKCLVENEQLASEHESLKQQFDEQSKVLEEIRAGKTVQDQACQKLEGEKEKLFDELNKLKETYSAEQAGLKEQLAILEKDNRELNQRNSEIVSENTKLAAENKEIKARKDEAGKEIEKLKEEKRELQFRQNLIDDEIVKVEAQIEFIKDVMLREKAF